MQPLADTAITAPGVAPRSVRGLLGWPLLLAAMLMSALALAPAMGLIGQGSLAHHMANHIAIMNGVAVLLAPALLVRGLSGRVLATATVAQVAVLAVWHLPNAMTAMHGSPIAALAGQASLLAAALWFWVSVLAQSGPCRWKAVAALLVTGKLFCLFGAVLVFAPRPLYGLGDASSPGHGQFHVALPDALADQQTAGLLMLAACPATYVLAGVVIAARWIADLERAGPSP